MALIYDIPSENDPEPGTPEFDAYMQLWYDLNATYEKAGILVGGEALMPAETAACVRKSGGRSETMDGPFAETKEQLGGYYILDCRDMDEALHYAAMIPVSEPGTIEVRPVMVLPD